MPCSEMQWQKNSQNCTWRSQNIPLLFPPGGHTQGCIDLFLQKSSKKCPFFFRFQENSKRRVFPTSSPSSSMGIYNRETCSLEKTRLHAFWTSEECIEG